MSEEREVEVYFSDLSLEKQEEILRESGIPDSEIKELHSDDERGGYSREEITYMNFNAFAARKFNWDIAPLFVYMFEPVGSDEEESE